MTTEEQEAKIQRDLAETRRVINESNRVLIRINKAVNEVLKGADGDNRAQPA